MGLRLAPHIRLTWALNPSDAFPYFYVLRQAVLLSPVFSTLVRAAVVVGVGVVLLAGCGSSPTGDGAGTPTPRAQASTPAAEAATPEVQETTPAATERPPEESDRTPEATHAPPIPPITAEEAFAEAAPYIKYADATFDGGPGGWDFEHYKPFATFDPSSDLSYIHVHMGGANNDAATFVALFNKGSFVTMMPDGLFPWIETIEQVDPETLRVTSVAKRYGIWPTPEDKRAVTTYRWDKKTASVVLDPGPKKPVPEAEGPKGAHPGARGKRPAGATQITSVRPATEHGPKTAVVKTPSGNIGCDLGATYAGCGVLSYISDGKHEGPSGDSLWWFDLAGKGIPKAMPMGDAPYFEYSDVPAQVLNYGDVVYHDDFVCASAETGLTCWNSKTGHGVFMNKAGFEAF